MTTLAMSEDTTFNYELQGAQSGNVVATGGGFYVMAGRFHVTLIGTHMPGDSLVLDFSAKTADPLKPGQYSVGMFGQINAGLEIRAADRLAEFDATGGTLTIHSRNEGRIQGEFDLQATDMDNSGDIAIKGIFDAGSVEIEND